MKSVSRLLSRWIAPSIAAWTAIFAVAPNAGATPVAPGFQVTFLQTPGTATGDVISVGETVFAGVGDFGVGIQAVVRIDASGTTVLAEGFNSLGGFAYDAVNDRLIVGDNGGNGPGALTGDRHTARRIGKFIQEKGPPPGPKPVGEQCDGRQRCEPAIVRALQVLADLGEIDIPQREVQQPPRHHETPSLKEPVSGSLPHGPAVGGSVMTAGRSARHVRRRRRSSEWWGCAWAQSRPSFSWTRRFIAATLSDSSSR